MTRKHVPPPDPSSEELDDADLLEEDDADATDADATVVGSLHHEDPEPTMTDLPDVSADDDEDHDPTVIGSLSHVDEDEIEATEDAEPTLIGDLEETELTQKRKPIAIHDSPRSRKSEPVTEPKTNPVGRPRPSQVAEEKIESLLTRLESTPLASEKARIFKQIAITFRDELGDDDQAFDAFLEAFKAHPDDPDTKARLEELGTKLGRFGEVSSVMGLGSGEFQALRNLEATLRSQGKFAELGDVLDKEVECAPDREQRVDALLRHAEILEKQLVKPREAIEKFQAVLLQSATNDAAHEGVARCLVALRSWDDLAQAIEQRVKSSAKASVKSKLLVDLAEVHESKRNDIEAANDALLRAEKIDKRNKRVLYELARVSEKRGDIPGAAAYRGELAELTEEVDKKAQIHAAIGEMLAAGDRDPTAAKIHFEKAVTYDPKLLSAWQAIQSHNERSGNWARAAYALEMRADHTDTPRVKALLYADLGEMRHDSLEDPEGALKAYELALKYDPKLERAANAVLDEYVKRKDWAKAAPTCELLVHAATRDADVDRAFSLFVLGAKIAEQSGHPERAVLAALAAYELRSRSTEARARLIEAMHAAREHPQELARARNALERIVQESNALEPSTLVLLADVEMALGDAVTAADLLGRAAERDPRHAGALSRLADASYAAGDLRAAADHKRSLAATVTSVDEKYKLFVDAGEILAHQAHDFEGAEACYEEARKLKPNDHWILHTQLWLYGQMQAWSKMAKTLRAIANAEKDPVVRAKGIFAMAQVVRDKCDDPRWAAELFGEVLQIDPTRLDAFERIVRIFTELKDWGGLEKAYRAMVDRLQTSSDVDLKHAICHQLGIIYRDRLGDAPRAIAAFQTALKLKPDSAKDRKILSELYVVVNDLAAAVEVSRAGILVSTDVEMCLRDLYDVFLRQDDIDRAWCAIDVLAQMTTPNEEQRRFHQGHGPLAAREVPGTLNGAAWETHLMHTELDPVITAILSRTTPAVVRAKLGPNANRPPEEVLGPRLETITGDLAKLVVRAFYDAGEILGVRPPALHVRPKMSLPFVSAMWTSPAVFVSLELLAGLPRAALAFLAGKSIAQNRPEILARALFPSVSELKALAATGVRLGSLVDAGTLQDQADAMLLSAMNHEAIQSLRSHARRLNEAGGAKLDVKRWAELAELSAARAGLLIAGSTQAAKRANAVEGRSPADLPPKEWWGELALFATSDTYGDLRQAIGVDLKTRRSKEI